jgi:methionyl aminopeptidase
VFTKVKTAEQIESMRKAGKMLATVLEHVKSEARVGMSTKDLTNMADAKLKSLGDGQPSFLNHQGFPDVLCVSVNDEVVHGIPRTDHILQEGDVVSIDFGVTINGMITDAALTFALGHVDERVASLIKTTEQSLYAGIDVLKGGVRTGDIASAVQKVLQRHNLGIIRDLVGHGVGHELHEEPNIPNYGFAGSGPVLQAGMTIAIEPMATLGGYDVKIDKDDWTIRTKDGSLAAHFEHTILITERGYEILTIC